MSAHLGAPVGLEPVPGHRGGPPKPVLRCRVTAAPAQAPETVIVKHGSGRALLNEWAGLAFLSHLRLDPPLSPTFYGGDLPGEVLVYEDLGDGDDVAQALLGADAARAQAALVLLGAALGRMHAASIGRASQYRRLRTALGPLGGEAIIAANALGAEFHRAVGAAGLSLGDAERDVERVIARITEPGPLLAYVHGDACPGNERLVGERVVLLDFATGGLRHALLDGVCGRVPFPSCWCVRRLPTHIAPLMEEAYRSELIRGCPAAEDDAAFAIETAAAWAYWLIETTTVALASTPFRDSLWGTATVGQRLALRVELFAQMAGESGRYRALAALLTRLVGVLDLTDEQMPLYPAFGGPPPSS